MSGILPNSFNDYFSWRTYESLPKSGEGTDIFFFGATPVRYKIYTAWHMKPQSVFPHTRRYRLLKAICERDINEVKEVLDKKFNMDEEHLEDKYGYKAAGIAAALNRVGILEYLILRGADINTKDKTGNTPLMHAVINWQYDAIRMLVENGADLSIKDNYGLTVIDKAKFRGLTSVASFLEGQLEKKKTVHFPKFTVQFDFEEHFSDPCEVLYKKKKYYKSKPLVYPFNNLEGTYSASFISYDQ
jgi:hypothetical protein